MEGTLAEQGIVRLRECGRRRRFLRIVTGGKPNIAAAQKLAKIAYSRLK